MKSSIIYLFITAFFSSSPIFASTITALPSTSDMTNSQPKPRPTDYCWEGFGYVMPDFDEICKLTPRIIQASIENTISRTNNFTVPSIQVIKSNNMFMQSMLVNFTTDSQVETDYDEKDKVLTITIRPQHLEPVEEEPLKEEEDLAAP